MQFTHKLVSDQSVQLDEIKKTLNSLLARSGEILYIDDIPEFLSQLPVSDDGAFVHLNELLKYQENEQATIKFLAGIGGKTLRCLTTNMLRRLLEDEVAQLYSLTGKSMKNSKKKCFLATESCRVIFKICRKFYDNASEMMLREITSDWLNQAKFRMARKAERKMNN